MKQEQEFLNNWINSVAYEQQPNEPLDYSEREVLEMLKDYKEKFSLSDVGKSFCGCKKPQPNYPEMVWCDKCTKEIAEN